MPGWAAVSEVLIVGRIQKVELPLTVPILAPFAVHTHVKDQRGRAPDHQFLTPGEGDFDYVRYLRAMRQAGYDGFITVEVSVMVQRRPDYDPFAAAELGYRTLAAAFAKAFPGRS